MTNAASMMKRAARAVRRGFAGPVDHWLSRRKNAAGRYRRAMPIDVRGAVAVPHLAVDPAVLGQSFDTAIDDVPVRLTFPVVVAKDRLGVPDQLDLSEQIEARRDWGHRSSDTCFHVNTVVAEFVIDAESDDPVQHPLFTRTAYGVQAWQQRVAAWMSAWLRMPSVSLGERSDATLWALRPDGTVGGTGALVGGTIVANEPAADADQVRSALAHAGRGERPPTEHVC